MAIHEAAETGKHLIGDEERRKALVRCEAWRCSYKYTRRPHSVLAGVDLISRFQSSSQRSSSSSSSSPSPTNAPCPRHAPPTSRPRTPPWSSLHSTRPRSTCCSAGCPRPSRRPAGRGAPTTTGRARRGQYRRGPASRPATKQEEGNVAGVISV